MSRIELDAVLFELLLKFLLFGREVGRLSNDIGTFPEIQVAANCQETKSSPYPIPIGLFILVPDYVLLHLFACK